MGKQKTLVPWFQRGDIGGMTYSITNNIVNYLIVIATLSGVLEWPDKIVYGYVIPGMSIGLLCSGVYYAYMGRRLSRKEGRADVTALPSGVSTPAMFVMLYGVIMPLHYALNDAVSCCGSLLYWWSSRIFGWIYRTMDEEKTAESSASRNCGGNRIYLDGNTGGV